LLKISQYLALRKQYRIVFWDLMPYDFDRRFGHDNSLAILKKKKRPGSVIVLHDNAESSANLILEDFIKFAKKEGYNFGTI
jgi:peptidoglycan/xylan/chitin deacetylase (PgdA/CDA1 family)